MTFDFHKSVAFVDIQIWRDAFSMHGCIK